MFLPVPQATRIPFFSNFLAETAIPNVEDRALSAFFQNWSLVATPTTLVSSDSGFVTATEADDEDQSREDGLARFTRTWTIKDACNNTRVAVQPVAIEHPEPAQGLLERRRRAVVQTVGAYSAAANVVKQSDPCRPGMQVTHGEHQFRVIGAS